MKNVVILHGAGETKESFWLPYVEKELITKGYLVSIPELPDTNNPDLDKWLPRALREKFDEETVLISHSAGGALLLSVLERIKVQVKKAILVAGYWRKLPPPGANGVLQKEYDFRKIKQNCREFVFINSNNDPWGCDDKQGKEMQTKLGGKLIVLKGEGHMGSDKYHQPYREFPLLISLVE